ncbi:hypothetical protein PV02_11215 [Methanolobus chelungpuianus]|uniref:Uncharacterized protein n=1 Tax=Methanolobus chelungpuianus TaxID=502115 RepID=A0AAE3HBN5_9EURY|nr:hypothetical protein [Methanolobus chelungpuianus]
MITTSPAATVRSSVTLPLTSTLPPAITTSPTTVPLIRTLPPAIYTSSSITSSITTVSPLRVVRADAVPLNMRTSSNAAMNIANLPFI